MANHRKPTALKQLAGTYRKHRGNPKEPEPAKGVPLPPEHLSERARTAFKAFAGIMHDAGYLTVADGIVVEQLAQTYADWRDCVAFCREHGTTYVTVKMASDGTEHKEYKQYPQVTQRSAAAKQLRMLLKDCGLTPSDRSKVSMVEDHEESPWAQFMDTQ